jgi:RNA polymerase sigma-70 factor (ECF subfamily)
MQDENASMERRQRRAELEQAWARMSVRIRAYFACRVGGGEADDLVQECFLRAFQSWDGHADRGTREGWIWRIAVRTAIDAYRRRRPTRDISLQEIGQVAAAAETAATGDEAAVAWRAIDRLDPSQREVLYLRFAGGLSYAEIAEALNVPLGTVRSRLHRALSAVRESMERQSDGSRHD